MKEFLKHGVEKNAKQKTVLLDLGSICNGVMAATDGRSISPTLWQLLKKAEEAKLGSTDNPLPNMVRVSQVHESQYVYYAGKNGYTTTSLEADVILLLRYRLRDYTGDRYISEDLFNAHSNDLKGYVSVLYARHCGKKKKDDCTNTVWKAYLEHLQEYCVVIHGTVHNSTHPYVFEKKVLKEDRKERARMSKPVVLPADVLQAEDSVRKKLRMRNIPLEEVTLAMLEDMMTARDRNNVSPETLLMLLRQDVVVVTKVSHSRYHGEDGIAGYEDSLSELNQSGIASTEDSVLRNEIHELVGKVLAAHPKKNIMERILYDYCVDKELKLKDLAGIYDIVPNKISAMKKELMELLRVALSDYEDYAE